MKNTLKERYEAVCNEYIKQFCKKQEMDFDDGWAAGTVGGVANIGDYFFNFDDIRLDIDTNQPKGVILNHYDDNLEAYYNEPPEYINYQSYIKGLRVSKTNAKNNTEIPKERQIIRLISKCIELLGGQSDILSSINSWKAEMSDDDTIEGLQAWIKGHTETLR